MSRLLKVKDTVTNLGWMNHLPDPLRAKQKVVVSQDQENVAEGYIRVKHGNASLSVFNMSYFDVI